MRPQIKSYNGTLLNDVTNYETSWPIGALLMSPAQIIEVERSGTEPFYAGKKHAARAIPLMIQMKGSVYTQLDSLLTLFDPDDDEMHSLVVVDLDSVGLDEWTIQATTYGSQPKVTHNIFRTTLYATGSTWKASTPSSGLWTVAASGDTKVLAVGGKISALPTITISPQASKDGSYAKKMWVPITNNTTNAAPSYPIELTNGGLDTAALVADVTVSNQINQGGGISDVDVTIPIDTAVGGGLASSGMGYVDTEQISWTGNTGTELTGCERGLNGTTAAAHADNAVITRSQMQADGDDWRALVDGVETYRWLSGMNSAASKMWITLSLSPKIELTLLGAIAGAGAITTISVKVTVANRIALTKIGQVANKVVTIGTGAGLEAFTFTGVSMVGTTYTLTGVTRAEKETSASAHADGDTIRWVEHDVWMAYWNDTVEAPETNDDLKPLINLSTSTNTSWDWDEFVDLVPRPAAWVPSIVYSTGKLSAWYADNHNTFVMPATEMGMALQAYQLSNLWRAETGIIQWSLMHPFGITTVSWSGEKYRYAAQWPVTAILQKGILGYYWLTVANEATPSAVQTWEALAAHAAVALGATYKYLRFYMYGSLAALADNSACLEISDFTAVLTDTPTVAPQAVNDNYHYDITLTNTTNGDVMRIVGPGAVGDVLTIDCENKIVSFASGGLAQSLVSGDWIELEVGNNTMRYDEVGTTDVDLTFAWYNRRKL